MVEQDNEPQEGNPLGGLTIKMPEKHPVVMSGEGVGQMLEATANFIEGVRRVEPIDVIDPETGKAIPAFLDEHGVHPVGHGIFDNWRENPRSRIGIARLTTLDSFIAHVNRFGDEDSAVFVNDDPAHPSLRAVLDYHRRDTLVRQDEGEEVVATREHGEYRWGRHQSQFDFPLSEEWQAWTERDKEQFTMTQFSDFLEKRAGDIDGFDDGAISDSLARFVQVNGGKDRIASFGQLLELSRGLRVNENSAVEQAINLATGEGQIRFAAEHSTSVKVPTMFFIAIPIFKRGVFYRIGVQLRYRKLPTGLVFWYELNRPDLSFDHALREAVERVDRDTEAQVFFGQPE